VQVLLYANWPCQQGHQSRRKMAAGDDAGPEVTAEMAREALQKAAAISVLPKQMPSEVMYQVLLKARLVDAGDVAD